MDWCTDIDECASSKHKKVKSVTWIVSLLKRDIRMSLWRINFEMELRVYSFAFRTVSVLSSFSVNYEGLLSHIWPEYERICTHIMVFKTCDCSWNCCHLWIPADSREMEIQVEVLRVVMPRSQRTLVRHNPWYLELNQQTID